MIHFGVVSPFVLLIVLMASPMLGILFAAIFAQSARIPSSLRSLAWLPAAIGAGAALISAWLLRGQPAWEAIVGNWSPVSFTGLPLALTGFVPTTAVLIAWTTLYFLDSLKLPDADPFQRHPVASALLIASLTTFALGNNLITLLIGLGLTDLLSAYLALRRQANERNTLIGLTLNGVSIALLTLVIAVHAAGGSSLYLPMTRLTPSVAPALALAIALRLGFAPFRTSADVWGDMGTTASAVGGLLLLIRLPTLGIAQLPAWFYGLALVSALLTLAIAILQAEEDAAASIPFVRTAGVYLAALSATPADVGVTAAAVIAWLIGSTLIAQTNTLQAESVLVERGRRAIRVVGALGLIGLPLTVGFIGQVGVVATWANRGPTGWLMILAWIASLALLVHLTLHIVFDTTRHEQQKHLAFEPTARLGQFALREVIGWLAATTPIVIFGVAPDLLGAGTLIEVVGRNGIVGWLGWIIAIAVGVLFWRLGPRWRPFTRGIRDHAIAVLDLGWLHSLLEGATARLRRPFGSVFTFLESEGALLWAIIVALLVVLISRPGGP